MTGVALVCYISCLKGDFQCVCSCVVLSVDSGLFWVSLWKHLIRLHFGACCFLLPSLQPLAKPVYMVRLRAVLQRGGKLEHPVDRSIWFAHIQFALNARLVINHLRHCNLSPLPPPPKPDGYSHSWHLVEQRNHLPQSSHPIKSWEKINVALSHQVRKT